MPGSGAEVGGLDRVSVPDTDCYNAAAGRATGVSGREASSPLSFCYSNRRRHTRFDCDWSSDVCSSDLTPRPAHPEDLHLAPVGGGESVEDLDGGRLARPVGPQESEALACIDGEIEPRDRYDVRVALREPGTTDRGNEHSQTGFLGSGGVVACFMAASSCM